jgi:hypothetical protein
MDTRTDAPLLLSHSATHALVCVGSYDVRVELALDSTGNAYVAGSEPRHQAAERFVAADQDLLDMVAQRAWREAASDRAAFFRTGERV